MSAHPRPATFALYWVLLFALVAALGIALLSGCSTVVPAPVVPKSASYGSGGARTSGIVAKSADGTHYLVDDSFRARYNALAAIYGNSRYPDGAHIFSPPLEKDFGVAAAGPGLWTVTNAAMADMVVLSDLNRKGAAP